MANALTHHFVDWSFKGLKVVDLVSISTTKKQAELSDLAWDAKNKQLYGITDKGRLVYFDFSYNQQKITQLDIKKTVAFKNKKGKPLAKDKRDSEGLSLISHTPPIFAVSFERQPKINYYDLDGKRIKKIKLPKVLRNVKDYRSINRIFEGLINHPKYGLITAPERALKQYPLKEHRLYQVNGDKEWILPTYPKKNSSITALEIINNNRLLVLERALNKKKATLTIILRDVTLHKNGQTTAKTLAVFDNHQHWPIDNFEGLTRLEDNLYLMVSDDGNSKLQQTLFMLFKIMPK